ncbi:MAG: DUF4129 domain-containing protein [Coriobacteriia bacterium]|nr:DUF4129 domain-containing protein [Coriobacteriia bacterium]
MSRFVAYMASQAWDCLLTVLVAASASGLVATAYWSGDAFVAAPWLFSIPSALALILLYAASFSKRGMIIGAVGIPVLTVVALVAASAGFNGAMFDDTAGNPCPPLLATIVTSVIAFLLTRRRPGIVVLMFVSILLIGYLQFIYKEGHVVLSMVLLCSLAAMLAFRGFTQSRSQTVAQQLTQTPKALALCLLCALALLGVGSGVYAAVVAPLNPPTMEIKLIKELLALPQVDMTGIADRTSTEDKDKTSNKTNDEEQLSNKKGDDKTDQNDQGKGQDEKDDRTSAFDAFDPSVLKDGYDAVTHDLPPVAIAFLWMIPPLLVALILFGLVRLKLHRRARRLRALKELPAAECAIQSYLAVNALFNKIKIPARGAKTPTEHAASVRSFTQAFRGADGTDFCALTNVFVQARYGHHDPSPEQIQQVNSFMDALYANCRAHLGTPSYLLRFFRL